MRSSEKANDRGIPRWSAPWAAGWAAMSDVSRIDVANQAFKDGARPRHPHARGNGRTIGLAIGVFAAVCVVATTWL